MTYSLAPLCAWQLVFRNPISLTGAVGSAIGILGVLVYSLTKYYYDNLAASAARQKVVVAEKACKPILCVGMMYQAILLAAGFRAVRWTAAQPPMICEE
eukprot:30160-Eustigmatos_ZCMA.PRE.1